MKDTAHSYLFLNLIYTFLYDKCMSANKHLQSESCDVYFI